MALVLFPNVGRRDPTTAGFERGQLVQLILTKVVFAYEKPLVVTLRWLVDDLRPAVLAVLISLHQNGILWLIPWDSTPVACLICTEEETYALRLPGARLALVVMAHVS